MEKATSKKPAEKAVPSWIRHKDLKPGDAVNKKPNLKDEDGKAVKVVKVTFSKPCAYLGLPYGKSQTAWIEEKQADVIVEHGRGVIVQ